VPGGGAATSGAFGDIPAPAPGCRLGREDVFGTHHGTDIMAKVFRSPWKVLVLLLAVVVVVLVALFGSKKMPVSD
jgi:hypothetical protein